MGFLIQSLPSHTDALQSISDKWWDSSREVPGQDLDADLLMCSTNADSHQNARGWGLKDE